MVLDQIKNVIQSLGKSQIVFKPFKHWLLKHVFSDDIYNELIDLPLNPLNKYHLYGQISSYKNQLFLMKNLAIYSLSAKK